MPRGHRESTYRSDPEELFERTLFQRDGRGNLGSEQTSRVNDGHGRPSHEVS
jgi:hypothetical protein